MGTGIKPENYGNDTNADGIERKREWAALEQIHSCFSFLYRQLVSRSPYKTIN